ncbi:hypothetical protein OG791_34715 [Streptomyces canus]
MPGIVELSAEFGHRGRTAQKALAHLRDTGQVSYRVGLGQVRRRLEVGQRPYRWPGQVVLKRLTDFKDTPGVTTPFVALRPDTAMAPMLDAVGVASGAGNGARGWRPMQAKADSLKRGMQLLGRLASRTAVSCNTAASATSSSAET